MIIKTSPRGRNLMHDRAESIYLYGWELRNDCSVDEFDVDQAIQRVACVIRDAKKLDQHLKAQRRAALKKVAQS
jgi:hypothetical protein